MTDEEILEIYGTFARDREGRTRLYRIYDNMCSRCYCPSKGDIYRRYGGRGIRVCDEWRHSFPAFRRWAIEAGYRDDTELSIDRIDCNGDYCPANCRFADRLTQNRNRRDNRKIRIGNSIRCLVEWLEIFGLKSRTFYSRTQRGWDPERALVTPVRQQAG